jgi:hypothetical protein
MYVSYLEKLLGVPLPMDKSYWDKHTVILLYCGLINRWGTFPNSGRGKPGIKIGAAENRLRFQFFEGDLFWDTEIDFDAFGKSLGSIWTTFSWTEYFRVGTKPWVELEKISDLMINVRDMSLKGWGFNHEASDQDGSHGIMAQKSAGHFEINGKIDPDGTLSMSKNYLSTTGHH